MNAQIEQGMKDIVVSVKHLAQIEVFNAIRNVWNPLAFGYNSTSEDLIQSVIVEMKKNGTYQKQSLKDE